MDTSSSPYQYWVPSGDILHLLVTGSFHILPQMKHMVRNILLAMLDCQSKIRETKQKKSPTITKPNRKLWTKFISVRISIQIMKFVIKLPVF